VRERLLEVANSRAGNRFLFGGTRSDAEPFVESAAGGVPRVAYAGDDRSQQVLVGLDQLLSATLPGDEVFALSQRSGTRFAGLTGVAGGQSADQGSGYLYLHVRHDATTATGLAAGVALASGGAADTIVGAHALTVDGAAGTVRLGQGQVVTLPPPGSPELSDVVVRDEHLAEAHLDFSGYTGGSFTATLDGTASLSLDGASWTAVSLTETDLELVDSGSGTVLHLDTRGLRRAGVELVAFGGAVNVFDTLQGIADDLENVHDLDPAHLRDRLVTWLDELDRNLENVHGATGELGALSQRAGGLAESFDESVVQMRGLLSDVEDADFSEVVLQMTRAEQTLQLAQATSVRLLQNSLLNFL
jgi:flagellin-like hook-associated protein FlgL